MRSGSPGGREAVLSNQVDAVGLEQYRDRLQALRERFDRYASGLEELTSEASAATVRTVIVKGTLANPTPFDAQRTGEKGKVRVLKAPVSSDDCRKYHYDSEDRIVMIEEYSRFLGCFRVVELFQYGAYTELLRLDAEILVRLFEFDHAFGNTELCLSYSRRNGFCAEEFCYEGGLLRRVRVIREQTEVHEFFYDGQALAQIIRVCPNRCRELLYSTKKPDLARIGQMVLTHLRQLIGEAGDFRAIGIEGFLDQNQPMLCVTFSAEEEPPELIADWGVPFADLAVDDWCLNPPQLRQCVKLIAQILVQLEQEGLLHGKKIYFHQNQVCVTAEFSAAKAVFKDAGLVIS